jgi:hypothetical protein
MNFCFTEIPIKMKYYSEYRVEGVGLDVDEYGLAMQHRDEFLSDLFEL